MDDMLVWGLALMCVAAVILVIEIFLPSAGMLGFAAAMIAIAGIVCLWRYDDLYGAGGLLLAVIAGPAATYYGLKMYRFTPFGKKMIGIPDAREVEAQRVAEDAEKSSREALLGQVGVALTDMHPIGVIQIGSQRLDALAETMLIRRGQSVRVTSVASNEIKVRLV